MTWSRRQWRTSSTHSAHACCCHQTGKVSGSNQACMREPVLVAAGVVVGAATRAGNRNPADDLLLPWQ